MSAIDIALPRVKTEEGFRSQAYKDTEGNWTIGYGWNINAGITEPTASALLLQQLSELHSALLVYSWYAQLDEARQSVCLDIAFNSGLHGFLGFPSMISALMAQDWQAAQAECHVINPELASRYAALGQILLTGVAS